MIANYFKNNIEELKNLLCNCYSKDLCYYKVQETWNEKNSCLGMCAITSLVANDYLKGEIGKIHVNEVSHYFNIVDNEIIDLTSEQFDFAISYDNYIVVERNSILNEDTTKRYKLLKNRLNKQILQEIDKKVSNCNKCQGLVEKFPNQPTVFLGKDNTIVLIGEAPANNGWRKSNILWRDINGKTLPSGVILQKLFDIIDRNIFETTFLEAVKCYPLERKNLKTCSRNCKNIMLEQLEVLDPKLVITLGEFPTRVLLDFKFDKFSEVVGKTYTVDNYKIVPIYHPSPISPKSYKGNVPIFESLLK